MEGRILAQGKPFSVLPKRLADWSLPLPTVYVIPTKMPVEDSQTAQSFSEKFSLDYYYNLHNRAGRVPNLKREAAEYGFDAETYIVDPEAHFDWLHAVKAYVIVNSEFFLTAGRYDLHDDKLDFVGSLEVQPSEMQMICFIRKMSISGYDNGRFADTGKSLLKSSVILERLIRTLVQLEREDYCSGYFSFLVEDPNSSIAKLTRVTVAQMNDLLRNMKEAIMVVMDGSRNHHPWDHVHSRLLTTISCVIPLLEDMVGQAIHDPFLPLTADSLCKACRVGVLLFDFALVSYATSHIREFGASLSDKISDVAVDSMYTDVCGFRCQCRRLTCLDGFVDSNMVWVFKIEVPVSSALHNQYKQTRKQPRLSILSSIDLIADVWGPVYGVQDERGRIVQYNTSKGVIRRSGTHNTPTYQNSVACHWEARPSYFERMSSQFRGRFFPRMGAFFQPEDVLLIGDDGLEQNGNCSYTLGAFSKDFAKSVAYSGARGAEWRIDSRNLGVSASKYVGISFGLTQKLYPATTIKQQIWDSWTNSTRKPSPLFLQKYFGLEVSHCTGNAKRVPFKSFIQRGSLHAQLELQFPGWTTSSWGEAFLAALNLESRQSFLQFWKDIVADRERIADLAINVLSILNDTGATGDFLRASLLVDGEENMVSIPQADNSWSSLLQDTPSSATYASMDAACIRSRHRPVGIEWSECSQAGLAKRPAHTLLQFDAFGVESWNTLGVVRHNASEVLLSLDKNNSDSNNLVLTVASLPWLAGSLNTKVLRERESCFVDAEDSRLSIVRAYVKSNRKALGGMRKARSTAAANESSVRLPHGLQQPRRRRGSRTPADNGVAAGYALQPGEQSNSSRKDGGEAAEVEVVGGEDGLIGVNGRAAEMTETGLSRQASVAEAERGSKLLHRIRALFSFQS